MKTLFLTSDGLSSDKLKKEFLKIFRIPSELKVLLMYGVRNDEELKYVNESENELIKIGFKKENIIHINFGQDKIKKPRDFDVIYFCGGNTYYILNRIRKLNLDKLIINFVNNNGVYIGVSAGSIIMGPNIEIAGWGSEGNSNDVNLKNLDGLNFTNIAIFPHFRDELKKEVEQFSKKVKYSVQELRNGEAILILNDKAKIIK
jgi:dipeptidase E